MFFSLRLFPAGSPIYHALKAQNRKAWSLYFYVQTILGAALILRAPNVSMRLGGGILVISALGLLYAWRRDSQKRFQVFSMSAVTGDLKDVPTSYSAPGSAFWVAEVTNGKDAGKVVGCAGLGK